jgi:hypothetical protein
MVAAIVRFKTFIYNSGGFFDATKHNGFGYKLASMVGRGVSQRRAGSRLIRRDTHNGVALDVAWIEQVKTPKIF